MERKILTRVGDLNKEFPYHIIEVLDSIFYFQFGVKKHHSIKEAPDRTWDGPNV